MANMNESELIERFLTHAGAPRADVVLGIGDDAAITQVPAGQELVLTTDSLVEGAHFLPGSPARSLGHRSLAINLSDLAAMGALPAWALLSLTMPAADADWLEAFMAGFAALAREHQVALVGGNLARGPLAITLQLAGLVPAGTALRRSGARSGDLLCVSGTLGDARGGLDLQLGRLAAAAEPAAALLARFEYPTARLALGSGLRAVASACIDISDGLLTDAARLLTASRVGAQLRVGQLPLSAALRQAFGENAWQHALLGGEDYELCFTVPPARAGELAQLSQRLGVACTACGVVRAETGLELVGSAGVIQFSAAPFDHFQPHRD
ncbi:MAG TPA: thiamine-phosphate kinase [Steroidobacteraceae bacterium]